MKASDIPEDTKNQLLSAIQSKLGEDEYKKLVRRLGKDGLIDAIVNGDADALSGKGKGKGKGSSWISDIIFIIVMSIICLIAELIGEDARNAIIGVCIVGIIIYFSYKFVTWAMRQVENDMRNRY